MWQPCWMKEKCRLCKLSNTLSLSSLKLPCTIVIPLYQTQLLIMDLAGAPSALQYAMQGMDGPSTAFIVPPPFTSTPSSCTLPFSYTFLFFPTSFLCIFSLTSETNPLEWPCGQYGWVGPRPSFSRAFQCSFWSHSPHFLVRLF